MDTHSDSPLTLPNQPEWWEPSGRLQDEPTPAYDYYLDEFRRVHTSSDDKRTIRAFKKMGLYKLPSRKYWRDWFSWRYLAVKSANRFLSELRLSGSFEPTFEMCNGYPRYCLATTFDKIDFEVASQLAFKVGMALGQYTACAFQRDTDNVNGALITLRFAKTSWTVRRVQETLFPIGQLFTNGFLLERDAEILWITCDFDPRISEMPEDLLHFLRQYSDIKVSIMLGRVFIWYVPKGCDDFEDSESARLAWVVKSERFMPLPTKSEFLDCYSALTSIAERDASNSETLESPSCVVFVGWALFRNKTRTQYRRWLEMGEALFARGIVISSVFDPSSYSSIAYSEASPSSEPSNADLIGAAHGPE
jgi:hypothetical protein